jgi:hypothetical protein
MTRTKKVASDALITLGPVTSLTKGNGSSLTADDNNQGRKQAMGLSRD